MTEIPAAVEGMADCPKCGRYTYNYDRRSRCNMCLSPACYHSERVLEGDALTIARLTAESEGRLKALTEKAAEAKAEWIRAENAEAERDRLKADLVKAVEEEREACRVIAHSHARAGETCQRDGGCRHVPCLVARQIASDIRSRSSSQTGKT